MRISDWSSDVCSSDLLDAGDRSAPVGRVLLAGHGRSSAKPGGVPAAAALEIPPLQGREPRTLNPMQEQEMNRILSDAIAAHGGLESWRSVAEIGVESDSRGELPHRKVVQELRPVRSDRGKVV